MQDNSTFDPKDITIFDDMAPIPVYYSQTAIRVFSILIGVLFGSILMAMNMARGNKRNGIGPVIGFGVLFTTGQLCLSEFVPNAGSTINIAINIAGAYLLQLLFWDKYLGKDTLYIKRSVLIPGIIAFVLIALIVALIFVAGYTA